MQVKICTMGDENVLTQRSLLMIMQLCRRLVLSYYTANCINTACRHRGRSQRSCKK
ncbi:hypothetical protein QA612_08250 [Evansella sp. AB-P1]|uniref:hypothetical protein n=1 Tax=Evansella sp. AB-P1 TaxID=3037653 RepID=UPI00241E97DC|nr:hypothetical protein [Evansella sp. AB-P1]MDG5787484.1 hypothetical protein [Evansella sp. AB-P1]